MAPLFISDEVVDTTDVIRLLGSYSLGLWNILWSIRGASYRGTTTTKYYVALR